jgi:hypothetical protein
MNHAGETGKFVLFSFRCDFPYLQTVQVGPASPLGSSSVLRGVHLELLIHADRL